MKKWIFTFLSLLIPFTAFAYTKIGIIGDSISFPHPLKHWECFHYYLARDFDKEMNEPVRIINYSVGGGMTDTLMPRLKNLLANDRPDVVIIALGINDCTLARPYNEILHAYEEAIELLNEEEIPVMIGTIDAYAGQCNILSVNSFF